MRHNWRVRFFLRHGVVVVEFNCQLNSPVNWVNLQINLTVVTKCA